MRKRTTTRWYIGAWVVWLLVFVVLALAMRGSAWTLNAVPAMVMLAYSVMAAAALVMLVTWVAALFRLGQLRYWGWFAALLVFHVLGLGIVGMVAYAISGPDENDEVVYRPTET